jgi:hypothetical protein
MQQGLFMDSTVAYADKAIIRKDDKGVIWLGE